MTLRFRYIKMANVLMHVVSTRNPISGRRDPIRGWRQMQIAEACLKDMYAK
jgi:hypothetical protein